MKAALRPIHESSFGRISKEPTNSASAASTRTFSNTDVRPPTSASIHSSQSRDVPFCKAVWTCPDPTTDATGCSSLPSYGHEALRNRTLHCDRNFVPYFHSRVTNDRQCTLYILRVVLHRDYHSSVCWCSYTSIKVPCTSQRPIAFETAPLLSATSVSLFPLPQGDVTRHVHPYRTLLPYAMMPSFPAQRQHTNIDVL